MMNFNPAFASEPAASCKNVKGTLSLWNGWPPGLRIETDDKVSVYGVVEGNSEEGGEDQTGAIPEQLLKKVQSDFHVKGIFCIDPTGDVSKVPYDNRPIIMVIISKFEVSKPSDATKKPD